MFDAATARAEITQEALAGLTATPKTLPSKLFYDTEGVRLFEAISRLPEYYLTRTETALLARIAPELVALAPPGATLVEYGASDEAKATFLLQADAGRFGAYIPVDVAENALAEMAARLAVTMPELAVHPICADFNRPVALPDGLDAPRLGFFPGSTIGNLEPDVARSFLRLARRALGNASWLVVGVDVRKEPEILLPAYDDAEGVTAAFNLNMLRRLNREAAANFVLDRFTHLALWNDAESRIEMHLRSSVAQNVRVADSRISFQKGETIHTENSYKHSVPAFQALATAGGWVPARVWTDPDGLFSIHALRAR